MSQRDFGLAVGAAERDAGHPTYEVDSYAQQQVSQWIHETVRPNVHQLRAMEKVLGFRPGTLSRRFGYVPSEARSNRTVEEAIKGDDRLSREAKRMLLEAYRAATAGK